MSMRTIVLPAIVGLGAMALIAGVGQASQAQNGVSCGIETTAAGDMIALEGLLVADTAVSGSYQLRIASSGPGGNSNISQGGPFSANADDTISLGRVMVNDGSSFDIEFTVNANGAMLDCATDGSDLR